MAQLYIFDLDGTLWSLLNQKMYSDVLDILYWLKKRGDYIYLASFNIFAIHILRWLKIDHLFDGIRYGLKFSKGDMIRDIVKEAVMDKNLPIRQVYFYDDSIYNIKEVHGMNTRFVRPVHTPNGVHWGLFIG